MEETNLITNNKNTPFNMLLDLYNNTISKFNKEILKKLLNNNHLIINSNNNNNNNKMEALTFKDIIGLYLKVCNKRLTIFKVSTKIKFPKNMIFLYVQK